MAYMELEFPGDADERACGAGATSASRERWLSTAAGAGAGRLWVEPAAVVGVGARGARRDAASQRGASGHCHAYEAFGVNTAGTGEDTRRALGGSAGDIVEESVTINRPIEELYRFWRNLENLPRFMPHLRVGRAHHRHALALAGAGAWRQDGRVERGDHQRGSQQGDRLALDRRVGRGQRRFGELRGRRPGPRHARARPPAVQPARREGRRGRRTAARAATRPPRSARTSSASSSWSRPAKFTRT